MFQIAKNINTILMRIAKIKVKTSNDISLHLSLTLVRQDGEARSQSLVPSWLSSAKDGGLTDYGRDLGFSPEGRLTPDWSKVQDGEIPYKKYGGAHRKF